ncbi:MAG: bifunctional 5,10-methylenetetrahydrofolate dehydrogenase/5,10-methenyltetrahydrofolate cyclohydrolase [Clostridiales Family XIII bacterium]|nr:bifunctional 5,10-methylenetetrahydrofolate dehydrogenase/5,10-methenyltetrahydrofolate cyclohydrolase [Clostridiales Family XIII bacterium]
MRETKKLAGKPIADEMRQRDRARAELLLSRGVAPLLRVIRVGEKADDLAYEKRILSAAASAAVSVSVKALDADAQTGALLAEIERANRDSEVHGILLFRPLPKGMDEKAASDAISPRKDVDGVSGVSMARLYEAKSLPEKTGGGAAGGRFFLPCTAEAVLEILRYYGVPIEGKRAVVIGRSTVIGKPAALLLLAKDATVTVAHSRTENLPEICAGADILVCAAGMTAEDGEGGVRGGIGREYLSEKQAVIDVGIHVGADGALFGDVDAAAQGCPAALTPVPGGVGSVTAQILLAHVIDAAEDAAARAAAAED